MYFLESDHTRISQNIDLVDDACTCTCIDLKDTNSNNMLCVQDMQYVYVHVYSLFDGQAQHPFHAVYLICVSVFIRVCGMYYMYMYMSLPL